MLGQGSIGQRHGRVLAGLGATVVAVPARAELKIEHVDGIVIATDKGRHAADIERLKHVAPLLVEKPLATTAEEASRAVVGAKVHVGCCLRFDAALAEVKAKLPTLGRIESVEVECLSWLPDWRPQRDYKQSYSAREGEGGVLRDLIHEIDYCLWMFGRPKSVMGKLFNSGVLGIPVEESARLHLGFGHFSALLHLSFASKRASRKLKVIGEHGTLEWDGLHPADPNEKYVEQAKAWLSALSGGAAGPLATAEDGIMALRVCDGARR